MPEGMGYRPSPEEIDQAENMMTAKEKKMSQKRRREEIEQVISGSDTITNPSVYSQHYFHMERKKEIYSKFLEDISPNLKGNRLIDLGCGKTIQYMLEIARRTGALEYIGVDKAHKPTFHVDEKDDLTITTYKEDMLRFLSSQPDNSANITINGIDYCIIDPSEGINKEYFDLLAEEINRVSGKDHIVFGIESPNIFNRLENMGFERTRYQFVNVLRSGENEGGQESE